MIQISISHFAHKSGDLRSPALTHFKASVFDDILMALSALAFLCDFATSYTPFCLVIAFVVCAAMPCKLTIMAPVAAISSIAAGAFKKCRLGGVIPVRFLPPPPLTKLLQNRLLSFV